jgi:diaminopimelate epimerase
VVAAYLGGLPFYKMTGSGNDFVMVDRRHRRDEDWSAPDVQLVCARATGVGADGLVLLGPGSQAGAIRMTYYNSDGSAAAMCGNAALCATRLAAHLGLAPATGMRLETDAGVYESRSGGADRAELHLAAIEAPRELSGLAIANGERRAALAVVGVPHLVVLVDDVDQVAVGDRGRVLRFDPAAGPAGANVNFVSPGANTGQWRMRTYERGVEAETLACGTGAVAAACTVDLWKIGTMPAAIVTRTGLTLDVRARRLPTDEYGDIWLSGEARIVFRGVLA